MTRHSREIGITTSCVLGAALTVGVMMPAQADDKLKLNATTAFVTDYLFRGISNTNQKPAVQPEIDLGYGIFYIGLWGSNTVYGDGIEIDYYGGIKPTWKKSLSTSVDMLIPTRAVTTSTTSN